MDSTTCPSQLYRSCVVYSVRSVNRHVHHLTLKSMHDMYISHTINDYLVRPVHHKILGHVPNCFPFTFLSKRHLSKGCRLPPTGASQVEMSTPCIQVPILCTEQDICLSAFHISTSDLLRAKIKLHLLKLWHTKGGERKRMRTEPPTHSTLYNKVTWMEDKLRGIF